MSKENIEIIEMEAGEGAGALKEDKGLPPEELSNATQSTATDGKDDAEPQILPSASQETDQLDDEVAVIVRERTNSDNNSEAKSDVQLLSKNNNDTATGEPKSPTRGEHLIEKIHDVEANIHSFFSREWEAFKQEKKKNLRKIPKKVTTLDFQEMILEFKKKGKDPSRHWSNQAKKREGEKYPELLTTIVTGLLFTLLPNCAIVLDYITASEYLGGEYYLKYNTDNTANFTCRPAQGYKDQRYQECLEYDPVYGILTLSLTFISGIFWSFQIFYQFSTYLRQDTPEFWQRKRMIVLFFIPLAILSIVTFPLQLFIISLISVFNDQDQWILLTVKIGIAEGLFNAHFQYMLQLFVFFTRADRHPSYFQYLTAFGSLLFLAYSRVESLMLDREGHRMSPGQKAWWIIRYGPNFLLNCAFKVGSISLIVAMLRFNCIWLYGSVVIIWLSLQLCFNEILIPRRFYYLFIGAGMHAVSVAHIPEQIKLIDTHPDSSKNVLYTTRLTTRQLRYNLLFQNMIWFLFNVTVMVTLWIMSCDSIGNPDLEIPLFWPFTDKTYTLKENKVFSILQFIIPILLSVGLLSQMLLWLFEEKEFLNEILSPTSSGQMSTQVSKDEDSVDSGPPQVPGWTYVRKCEGSQVWLEYRYDETLGAGIQGRLNQVIYPLLNIWGNWVDKNLS